MTYAIFTISFYFFNCLLRLNSIFALLELVIAWCRVQYDNCFTAFSTFTAFTRYHNYSHESQLRPLV